MAYPQPSTGNILTVGVDELFFSTTDRRGVIQSANSVFLRMSQFAREEIVGAAHNIVRHPDMPGGVFRIMWDRLRAGLPMAVYVMNRSRTGDTYWVFSTVVPIGDGYLSVRSAPCAGGLWHAVATLYDDVRELERQVQSGGANRAAAAEAGAQALGAGLARLGFPTFDSFVRYVVPAEAAARAALTADAAPRPPLAGDLAAMVDGADAITHELAALLTRLDVFSSLASALGDAATQARATIASLREVTAVAAGASATVADSAPVLGRAAAGMSTVADEAAASIELMATELARVRRGLLELRFRIGLTRLHNDMATVFALEVAAGDARGADLADLPVLSRALAEEVAFLETTLTGVNAALRTVSARIEEAATSLQVFQRDMARWRLLVPRYGATQVLGPFIGTIDSQLDVGHARMAGLRRLAAQCVAQAHPFDPGPTHAAIHRITLAGERLVAMEEPARSWGF
ncbi:aerotaxis receptor [Sanguibacter gelidistatuariae]|uniref:Aerotaxis receptor n=1 Tax=Sanguibacter gelidistatuariae TaxID=1814289 RepID=A0A1G6UNF3_9MICO|nr:PAS domain-containing protein [Sanguibacter gelidistatuariae]SDD42266.1 aerotaxis receptor [Sanguibacter gelidistatuariae]